MSKQIFHLKNKYGQIVRTIHWNESKLIIFQANESNRILFSSSKQDINDISNDSIHILEDITVSKFPTNGIMLPGELILQKETIELNHFSKDVQVKAEDEGFFYQVLKNTIWAHVGILLIVLTLGWVVFPWLKPEETIVTIIPKKEILKPIVVQRPKTVKISKNKITNKKVKKANIAKRNVKKIKVKNVVHSNQKTKNRSPHQKTALRKTINVNKVGALVALGGNSLGRAGGSGLNLNSIGTGNGAGLNGRSSSGGSFGVAGKQGLVSGSMGNGQGEGGGGFDTRGKGGGKPGYGKHSLVGSSQGFSQPLVEDALIEGGLDKDQVAAVIRRNIGQITYCYEKGLQEEPSLSGRVTIDFTISNTGRVSTSKTLHSSLHDQDVENCMNQKLRTWKFPKPVGNVSVKVSYPFILSRNRKG